MSNSVDTDVTAHYEPSGSMLFAKTYFIAYGSERVKITYILFASFSRPETKKKNVDNEYSKCPTISYTKVSDKLHMQTVQTQIRLLLKGQFDQGLHFLPFH